MPIAGAESLTSAAISDVLAQSVPTRLLLINQGVDTPFRQQLERIAEEEPERIFLWSHVPSLPSLSATWNRALDFVWSVDGAEALVVNNDVRLHPRTLEALKAVLRRSNLFVSAVGVLPEQFEATMALGPGEVWARDDPKGGPDFSCFLLSQEAHRKYPFDEAFIPAYCEDIDTHRRYMLGGDGDRIFSVNLPFAHLRSSTLTSLSPEARAAKEAAISAGSRTYFARKWGGPVNQERYTIPFDKESDQDGVTTPELQRSLWPEKLQTS